MFSFVLGTLAPIERFGQHNFLHGLVPCISIHIDVRANCSCSSRVGQAQIHIHIHTRAHSSRVLRAMPSTPSLFVDCLVCKCAHLFDCEARALLHFLARFFQHKFILSSISPSSSFAPSKWRAVCFTIERNSLHTIFVGFNRCCRRRRTMHACSTSHSIASRFRAVRVYVAVKTNPKVQDWARYMHRSWYAHTHTHAHIQQQHIKASHRPNDRPTMSRSFYPNSRIQWRKHPNTQNDGMEWVRLYLRLNISHVCEWVCTLRNTTT